MGGVSESTFQVDPIGSETGGPTGLFKEAWDASVPKYFPDAEVTSTVDEATGTLSWTEAILNAFLRPLQLTEKDEESTEQKPLSDSS